MHPPSQPPQKRDGVTLRATSRLLTSANRGHHTTLFQVQRAVEQSAKSPRLEEK